MRPWLANLGLVILAWTAVDLAATRQSAAQTDEVVVAFHENWPPHYSLDKEGKPTGFAAEVLEELATRAGLSVRYVIAPSFPDVLKLVLDGEADVVPNLGITPGRMQQFTFTDPVETFTVDLFVRANAIGIENLDDLAGHEVGVVERNVGVRILETRPDIGAAIYGDVRTALFELISGRIDAVIYPKNVFNNLARQIDVADKITTVGPPLREIKRGIAVNKDRPDIVAALNPHVRPFVVSPEYAKIYTRWFGSMTTQFTSKQVVWLVIGALAVGFGTVFVWHYAVSLRINRELQATVADLRRAEARMIETNKLLEKANRAKSEFVATLSHEFRTPLNAILGFSELLRNEMMGPIGSRAYKEYAEDIHQSGQMMLSLVDDVLDLSSLEAGKREYHKESVEVGELVDWVLKGFESVCREKSLSISNGVPDDLPPILADKRSLTQILQNLVSNAVKYTNENGSVSVSARDESAEVSIVVSDTGIGIAADKLDQILEPFTQSHDDPHLAEIGSGLGLSITRRLVDAHDGTLSFESELGKGTTVTVRLPVAPAL